MAIFDCFVVGHFLVGRLVLHFFIGHQVEISFVVGHPVK